jgi:hypothetical protein
MPAGGWPAQNWNGSDDMFGGVRGGPQPRRLIRQSLQPGSFAGYFDSYIAAAPSWSPVAAVASYFSTPDPVAQRAQQQAAAYQQQAALAAQRVAAQQSFLATTGQYKPPAVQPVVSIPSVSTPMMPIPQAMESYRVVGTEGTQPAGPQLPVKRDYAQYALPGALAGGTVLLLLALALTGRQKSAPISNPRRRRAKR